MVNKKTVSQQSYQALKSRLDDVLEQLQADDVDLDEALVLYQQGQETIVELEKYLQKTAHSFEKLKPQA